MIRYLILLACGLLATPVFSDEEAKDEFSLSTPEQVATLSSEPSYLVGGLISPLSGQPVLRQTDLIVHGAQKITLSRIYIPPQIPCTFIKEKHNQEDWDKYHLYYYLNKHYKGWQFYPHLRLRYTPHAKNLLLTDPNGMSLEFRLSSGPNRSEVKLVSSLYGLSNTSGDEPSGKYDPRNTRISCEDHGNRIVVYATDGAIRFYYKKKWTTRTDLLYLLEKEILSNGKVLKYHYTNTYQLDYVESLDPKERFVYAFIKIDGSPWDGNCHFTSSSGLAVDYSYQRRSVYINIKEKRGKEREAKGNVIFPPILFSVSSPAYRHESLDYSEKLLLSSYSGKDDIFKISHKGFAENNPHDRVHKLQLPVGQNDCFEPVYELSYFPPVAGCKEGTTTVKSSDGTSIVYHFSKNLLTTLIQYFGQDGGLKKEKVFSWSDKNWLKALEMRDGQKNLLYRKSFEYDRFGNPKLEFFTGDLTGEGNQETFTTRRTFSNDGKHQLLREETDDGKVLSFSYLPNTHLVTSKLTKEGGHIILREFFIYDDCNNLIQTISDDGASEDKDNLSHVKQRTFKTFTLRQAAPFLHMPEWIEETYLESGIEKPLKKSHLVYDLHGNIAKEEVYDAEGKHAYTICKTYNERGDVLTETNCLGQQAVYTYDPRGAPETATNFSHRIHKTFSHDTNGRLLKRTEKGDDGVIHVVSSDYDFHDRLTHQTDPFSNTTHYTYDPLVNKVTKTDFPLISSLEGSAVSVTTKASYDPLGRQLTKTDPNGNVTTYRYNAYGSPIEILHPNGGKERFRYAKNGKLISHTDPDGLTIQYKNDILGRVLTKTYLSADGTTLGEETFTYNGFNRLTETDQEGHLKQYFYDGSGRKIREEFCGHTTTFNYDSLGWLATVCQHNGDNTLLTHYKRDIEGKVLEKWKTDQSGRLLYKINYSYDEDGNQKTITRYINGKEAIDTFTYDSFSRFIQHQDAAGFLTTTSYNEHFINPLGQKVLQKRTLDPRHIATLETQDALARTVKVETLNSQEAPVACHELIHDPQGNLLYRKDHIYESDHLRNTQTIKYAYTSTHQIESLTRGFGTTDPRTTAFTYFPSGKLATKTLPDGVTLTYGYHPLGFMSRLDSSDGKIHHTFVYNKLGYLRSALDEVHHIVIRREVDAFGNIKRETFPYNLEITKDYDNLNRPLFLKIANQGTIDYTYDPLFLRQVTRISERGETLYAHTYEAYDLDGNLTSEHMIGQLGPISHLTEPRGQKSFISSPYFTQQCKYDAAGNLETNHIDQVEHRYAYDELSQLSSEISPSQSIAYTHNSLYNRTQKNEELIEVNDLNELVSLSSMQDLYDLNGNQILTKNGAETLRLTYDPLNRLIETSSEKQKVHFTYDPLGRRLSKTVHTLTPHGWKESDPEYYLYDDQNEIGAFTASQHPKNLRILGLAPHKDNPTTLAVETNGQVFAPLLDVQGNIRRLIDLETRTIAASYDFTAFGEPQQENPRDDIPWQFASKRFDPESGLIYFGKRYYDPHLGRWLTTDPAGFIDSTHLYQYTLNNPFRYYDPRGENLGGYLLGLGEIVLGGTIIVSGFALEVITVGGFTVGLGVTTQTGLALMGIGVATTTYHAQDLKMPRISWNHSDIYAPKRKEAIKKPPRFNGKDLGSDPSQCPGEGFEWRGKGSPESGKGNWLNPDTGEKLHPDLWHPDPKGPHWGYQDPDGISYDLFPNGSWQ